MPALRTYTSDVRVKGRLYVDGGVWSGSVVGPVNVKAPPFNAVGDGVADDTAAIQAAITAVRTVGGVVYFPAGTYRVTASLNCTGITTSVLYVGVGRGTIIAAAVTGAVFDFTGSSFQTLQDFVVSGNQVTTPTTAFLFARNSGLGSAGVHRMVRVWTFGYYTVAAVYNYASEEFQGHDCYFTQNQNDTAVVVQTGTNINGLTSAYATIATGAISNSVIHWRGCDFNNYGTGTTADALRMDRVQDFSFTAGMLLTLVRACVYIDATAGAVERAVFQSVRCETTAPAPTYGFRIVGSTTCAFLSIRDVYMETKAYGSGGRSLSAAVGSSLQNLTWEQVYDSGGAGIDVQAIDLSRIIAGAATVVSFVFATNRTYLAAFKANVTFTRPDLSAGNVLEYLDSGITTSLTGAATAGLRVREASGQTADVLQVWSFDDTQQAFGVNPTGGVKTFDGKGGYWERGFATELLTLSTGGTTTDTAANLLPANSIIEAVTARVTTTITTATNWKLGDPTTAGRFTAANATLVAGTTDIGLVHTDQTGAGGPKQTAAAKVRVTTTGTPGAGAIRITVFYRTFVAPTS